MLTEVKRSAETFLSEVVLKPNTTRLPLDETLKLKLSFNVLGHHRDAFSQASWEEAYNIGDTSMLLKSSITLSKVRAGVVKARLFGPERLVRKASFYWSKNPDLPFRIWTLIIDENREPRLPKDEDEAKHLFFDFNRDYAIRGADLGRGRHTLSTSVQVKWYRHTFIESGSAKRSSRPITVTCGL